MLADHDNIFQDTNQRLTSPDEGNELAGPQVSQGNRSDQRRQSNRIRETPMDTSTPASMRAVVLTEFGETVSNAIANLKTMDRPVPTPGHGEVLVRIAAAPCNPSDLLLLQGKYGRLKTLPTVPGWEGAGEVVASGGGWLARWLQGKRVACAVQGDRSGTWAEYCVAKASECIPLKSQMPIDQAASLIINPMTAIGLLESAKRAGHVAAVHTAGASQLGRMLLVTAAEMKFPLIHIVRREAQVDLLHSLGGEHVLNQSAEDFVSRLRSACEQLKATAAFEAIAGEMTGTVHNALPPGSTVYLYGALSEQSCGNIDPVELIFRQKAITGFFLGHWMRDRGLLGIIRTARHVQRMVIDGRIHTVVQRRVSLDEAAGGLTQYVDNMTLGKVLIVPGA